MALSISIVIDITAEAPGSPGVARTFAYSKLSGSPTVTLSLSDYSGVSTVLWEFVDIPVGSSAALSSATATSPTFTPDVEGTYLVQCKANDGEAYARNAIAFTTEHLALRKPASGETSEFGIASGWKASVDQLFDEVDIKGSENLNARDFGAKGDGSTDDTTALQNCINDAATQGRNVYIPEGHYKFTKLYLYYDAVLNPGWPTGGSGGYEGRITIFGDGEISQNNFYTSLIYKRTLLESTDATGPAIHVKSVAGYLVTNCRITDLSMIVTNTTYAIDFYHANTFTGLKRFTMRQKGTGGGVRFQSPWGIFCEDVFISGTTTNGKGLVVETLTGETGGGNNMFINVNTQYFDKGWVLGNETYGAGNLFETTNCLNCQATTPNSIGVFIGSGAKIVNWINSYIEKANSSGIGMLVRNYAQTINVRGCWFDDNDVSIELGKATNKIGQGAYFNVTIEGCIFNEIDDGQIGILKYYGDNSVGTEISNNNFLMKGGATTAKAISLEDGVHRGLVVRNNRYASGFANNIENEHRVNILESMDSTTLISSIAKLGDIAVLPTSATPSIKGGRVFETDGSTATITDFTDGIAGQEIIILAVNAVTITDGTNIFLSGSANFVMKATDTLVLILRSDGKWYQIGGSVN